MLYILVLLFQQKKVLQGYFELSDFVTNISGRSTVCYYLYMYHIVIFIDRMDNFAFRIQ